MMMHEFGYDSIEYGWIFILILFTIAIGLFISYINKSSSSNIDSQNNESALDILEKRLARGEVSLEEYRQIKSDLR